MLVNACVVCSNSLYYVSFAGGATYNTTEALSCPLQVAI